MSYYLNSRSHFDDLLILYQRDLATANKSASFHRTAVWYFKIKVAARYIQRSTKLTNYDDALAFAKAEMLRLQQAHKSGDTVDPWTFAEHFDDFYQRNINAKTWKHSRQTWHLSYANRYFKAYFSHDNGKSL